MQLVGTVFCGNCKVLRLRPEPLFPSTQDWVLHPREIQCNCSTCRGSSVYAHGPRSEALAAAVCLVFQVCTFDADGECDSKKRKKRQPTYKSTAIVCTKKGPLDAVQMSVADVELAIFCPKERRLVSDVNGTESTNLGSWAYEAESVEPDVQGKSTTKPPPCGTAFREDNTSIVFPANTRD